MYDLNILPINLQQGRQRPDTGALRAFSPPRRTARGRDDDILILSLSFTPANGVSPELKQTWQDHLAHTFYRTSGTVTAALRTLIETLNLTIMERNVKTAQEGIAVTGAVNMAVVHRHSLYIAQSGPDPCLRAEPSGFAALRRYRTDGSGVGCQPDGQHPVLPGRPGHRRLSLHNQLSTAFMAGFPPFQR